MKPEDKPPELGSRELEILAWLEGEMAADERAGFERRMAADQKLREEVEGWRDALAAACEWSLAEAPGAARVEILPIPRALEVAQIEEIGPVGQIGRTKQVEGHGLRFLWRAAAAAVIFLIGLWLGRSMPRGSYDHEAMNTAARVSFVPSRPDSISTQPVANQGNGFTMTVETPEPSELNKAPINKTPSEPNDAPPVQTAREEDGKVIIETSLRGSGARALWVVDGGFQVASTSHDREKTRP